jgi:two-component system, LuxR family, sensor kinase FixL
MAAMRMLTGPQFAATTMPPVLRFPRLPSAAPGTSATWSSHPAAVATAVGIAYWGGAQLGLALTFPPATTSVMWPPNAILTAALLLVPPRLWWICLAAAFPAHVILEIRAGFSPWLMTLLFLTNCSEALIAATAMRVARQLPVRFDTLPRVAVFIALVGLLGPMMSSWADAGIVTMLRDEPYWGVWRTRVFANVLTELSVVPAVIVLARWLRNGRWPTAATVAESATLLTGLVLVAIAVFGDLQVTEVLPALPRTPTVLLLPLFFWAAVRFGVGGVSAALLLSALVASTSTALGHRPFALMPPLASLMAVQMYLATIGMSLMCLCGVLDEKRRTAADLVQRLRFESLLVQISGSFVRSGQGSASAYDDALPPIGRFLEVDRVVLWTITQGTRGFDRIRHWAAAGARPMEVESARPSFRWTRALVRRGQTVAFDAREALPPPARADRRAYAESDVEAAVIVPIMTRTGVIGGLCVACRAPRAWSEIDLMQLRLIAEVLANACARDEAELEVQRVRHELAQAARLIGMGELTSSLAHELNQPLTGILSNAQAARRLLDETHPSIAELRAIVADIIDDDRRARDVIKRMREMLTRAETPPEVLDLNTVVREVALLITSDTIIRNVSIAFEFAAQPVHVLGVRIDLQQAVLNVLTNAMDAVAASDATERRIEVRVMPADPDARLVVRDSGRGFDHGMEDRMFDSFLTLSSSGWGTGLAIARCIVESHGGTIAAGNEHAGGAVVTVALPAVAGQGAS